MQFDLTSLKKTAVVLLAVALFCSFGIFPKKKKPVQPITKDTLQPDKVLFDRAVNDIQHGRYEVARLTLNTLINTYDSSEYLAKAKLAIADSWYREGGAHGLAQAEAEYKDFILFYPQMEEAAESQWKVCDIHYQQMEKADRDSAQAQRAEDECRVLVTQFPNSKYVPKAQQMLRNVQEVIGEKEFMTGAFYHTKGSYPAAANRLGYVADQYPLFSGADEALWQAADSYMKMGDRFENQAADDYTRIVRDYPLSKHADAAKGRLEDMKRPVPEADPKAVARMQYELANRKKPGTFSRSIDFMRRGPQTYLAAKQGDPAMQTMRPPTPVSVPNIPGTTTSPGGVVTATGETGSDVTVGISNNSEAIDKQPDARQTLGAGTGAAAPGAAAPGTTPAAEPEGKIALTPEQQATADKAAADKAAAEKQQAAMQQPLPTNHVAPKKTKKQLKQEEEMRKKQVAAMQKAQADAAKKQPDETKPDPTKPQPDSKQPQ
jgi:outer membrane protein assembly factor BamD